MIPLRIRITPQRCLVATSLMSSMSSYHQVHKIRVRKSAAHISLVNIGAVWLNMTANLAYAFTIKNPRLIFTFSNSFVSLSTLLANAIYYHNR